MNEPMDAKIADAVRRLQATLPQPTDVRIDWLTKMVEIGRYPVGRLVTYMESSGKTPEEILWKLADMLDEHPEPAPAQPAAAIAEEPVDDDPGPDGVRPE